MGSGRAVWQVSGGPTSRAYGHVFLEHGVALIGPGDAGAWTGEREDTDFEGSYVRRFASEVKVGDAMVLRTGTSRIQALGLVASDYLHVEAFDDVNGWDLQHARRVRWCPLPAEYDFGSRVFGANPTRFSRVHGSGVVNYVERFLASPPTAWQEAALPELPAEQPALDDVPRFLAEVVARVHDLHPLMWDRSAFGEHPTEDEIVAHLVVPLLRACGWPPERIAVKWRWVDVALFTALPRTPERLCFVVEAKRLGLGVEGALDQARGYVESLGVPCDVVVTDGVRYRLYSCDQDFAPVAYANLARLKQPALQFFSRLQRP